MAVSYSNFFSWHFCVSILHNFFFLWDGVKCEIVYAPSLEGKVLKSNWIQTLLDSVSTKPTSPFSSDLNIYETEMTRCISNTWFMKERLWVNALLVLFTFFLSQICFYLDSLCITHRSVLAYGMALSQVKNWTHVGACGDVQSVWTPRGAVSRAGRLCLTAFSNTSEVLSSMLSCKQTEQRMWRADNQRIGKEGFEARNALGMKQEDNSLGSCLVVKTVLNVIFQPSISLICNFIT